MLSLKCRSSITTLDPLNAARAIYNIHIYNDPSYCLCCLFFRFLCSTQSAAWTLGSSSASSKRKDAVHFSHFLCLWIQTCSVGLFVWWWRNWRCPILHCERKHLTVVTGSRAGCLFWVADCPLEEGQGCEKERGKGWRRAGRYFCFHLFLTSEVNSWVWRSPRRSKVISALNHKLL